jgi:transposase
VINGCERCLQKQRKIDELTEENQRLKAKLGYLKRKEQQGYFGSSTPSSKVPVKANTAEENQGKRGGAKPGHRGHGRNGFVEADAPRVVAVESELGDHCPECGGPLENKGTRSHSVIDIPAVKAERVVYRLAKQYCPHCKRSFQASPPGVLPKSLYSNQLMATAATMHYLHGIPMGRICEQIGISVGPLIGIFHRLARTFACVPDRLIEQYRQAPVKHADETSWRNDGRSGYAWLFATVRISIFLFRNTRSSSVVREVLGTKALPGTLVVDRYVGYNKVPCALQYCYSHLLRDVEELQKGFPNDGEVEAFVSTMAPLMGVAMGLRSLKISDAQFYEQAKDVKSQITDLVQSPAQHLGIRRIQEIFHENAHRLYHWAEDRRIPPDNNLAERDLRPTVIARKVSFGSQSDAGAHSRGVLMTVLHTLRKSTTTDPCSALKAALDKIAKKPTLDSFDLLFPPDPPPRSPP